MSRSGAALRGEIVADNTYQVGLSAAASLFHICTMPHNDMNQIIIWAVVAAVATETIYTFLR